MNAKTIRFYGFMTKLEREFYALENRGGISKSAIRRITDYEAWFKAIAEDPEYAAVSEQGLATIDVFCELAGAFNAKKPRKEIDSIIFRLAAAINELVRGKLYGI